MNGILLVDKPSGPTSFDVLRQLKRTLGKHKSGHTGTLDPFASGLMVVCFGEATKLVQFLTDNIKEYVGVMELGSETDSGDRDGETVAEMPIPENFHRLLSEVLPAFLGEIEQTPPRHSAIKVQGRRLYDYARKGEDVEVPTRRVTIHELEILNVDGHRVSFRVVCGKGTYIRTLAMDWARKIGTVGTLVELRRTRQGLWRVEDGVSMEADEEHVRASLLPSTALEGTIPRVTLNETHARLIPFGQRIPVGELHVPFPEDEPVMVCNSAGHLLAVARIDGEEVRVERGFAESW